MLTTGARLGPYEIIARAGAGGMGEVYRARDTRLNRTVAIKVLPTQVADSPHLRERLEREARALSSLSHAHICTLYDIGRENGTDFLVMEYLEGETLAARIARGPLSMQEVMRYGAQIADALDKAHRQGVIHRDLKPGNIVLSKSGAKLLDFGLAKANTNVVAAAVSQMTQQPTQAQPLTAEGTILGTLEYMAPEQLEGKEADVRTDIFALGTVLYEMATGRKAFLGKSQATIIAAILSSEPPSISTLQPMTPPVLDRAVKKCLAKDPDDRWQTAHDLRDELKWIAESPAIAPQVAAAQRPLRLWLLVAALVMLGVVAMVALAGWWRSTRPVHHPLTRLSVDLGPEALAGLNLTVAISPDGRRLVFPSRGPDGKQRLATRLLDQAQATLLPGTESGSDPFFSPDGQWIGFFTPAKLNKISVQGGAPVTLGVATNHHGASWGEDGNIIAAFGTVVSLSRISDAGGTRQTLSKLGATEITHRWPQVLPGAGAVLFTASPSTTSMENANIEAVSLRTGQVKILQRGGYYGRYLPSGHLLYLHQGVLFGVKFDPERLQVRGSPVPLLEDVAANPATGGGQFDFSSTGTFVYTAGKSAAQEWRLVWLDSSGKVQPLMAAAGAYGGPRLSPDGRKLVFLANSEIYVYDLDRDTTTRLTFTGDATAPIWAPDGWHVIFGSNFSLFWIRSDGAAESQRLLQSSATPRPWSFSPDGRRLAYSEINPETGFDIWTLSLDLTDPDHPKPGKPEPFLRTPADELVPRFSSDGRWIAYRSNESGIPEIYVRPFPAASGGKWQISTGGGLYGLWSNNGRELFYETTDNRIMVVNYTVEGASFMPGKPRVWLDKQLFYTGTVNLDLAPDGKRFAVFSVTEPAVAEKGSVQVTMLLNFFDELKRRIP